MKLVASLITHNEMGRYLPLVVENLLGFCDEIRALDDYSDDGTYEFLFEHEGVFVAPNEGPSFFEHEGKARNELLTWTFEGRPTHILATDADEFVADGGRLREPPPSRGYVWTLAMEEIWKADEDGLAIRMDGGWRAHPVCCFYAFDRRLGRIADRALACGREPQGLRRRMGRASDSGTDVLHFGWTNEADRPRRYQRYVTHDGGEFHRNDHLESIMWPDDQVELEGREWPADLIPMKAEILERTGATPRN